MAPGLRNVTALEVVRDRYLFGPILSRGPDGRVHMVFYHGEDHLWKGHAAVGYMYSDDDGQTWSAPTDIVPSSKGAVYDRLGSFGQDRDGKLIVLFVRRPKPGQKPMLFQTTSRDRGHSWSSPQPSVLIPADATPITDGWLYPFGPIKVTPTGDLAVMAYAGPDNSVLVSHDHGRTWIRHLIISTARPNYSEMGLEFVDKNTWVAISRVDGSTNQMAQFISNDSGKTWVWQGIPKVACDSCNNVAPTLDKLSIGGRGLIALSYCDRRGEKCWIQMGEPNRIRWDLSAWYKPQLFDQKLVGRSGYQSFVPSSRPNQLIGALVRERSPSNAEIVIFRLRVDPDL